MEPVPLDDIVPPGSRQVTLTAQWNAVQGCPAGHECWLIAWLSAPGNGFRFSAEPAAGGTDWSIWVYDVPEPLAPDSTYANESIYSVRAFVRACPLGEPLQTPLGFFNGCMGEAVATMTTDVRYEVAAWDEEADLDAIQTRLELS